MASSEDDIVKPLGFCPSSASLLGGTKLRTAWDTGPIEPGQRKDARWDAAWYGASVHCVRLDTEQELSEQQVVNALGGLPRCYSNW